MTDHPDIVERLQALGARLALEGRVVSMADCHEAAAEITRLRAEAEALRKALVELVALFQDGESGTPIDESSGRDSSRREIAAWDAAIAATKEQQA